MLKTRLVTAAIFSAIVIYILSFSPENLFHFFFVTIITVSIFFSGTEFAAMRWNVMDGSTSVTQSYPILKLKYFAIGFAYAFSVIVYLISKTIFVNEPMKILALPLSWVFFCLFLSAIFIYCRATDMHAASNKLLNVVAGFIYLSLPAICITELGFISFPGAYRNGHLYFFLATVLMGDTGAYFIGTHYGKHKLVPRISPKKSIEGALGGLFFSALTAVVLSYFFKLPFTIWYSILVGISVGIAGQIGDLIESAFKRAGGYKDSSHLLPGHGGFLDRIDSLILSIPVIFVFFLFYS